jgi:tetratricopeptide (TPR) repeat protein
MLVQKRRKQLHLQTARAIAQLYPSDDYVEMIAYHYAKTDEDAEAISWLEKAGDRAAAIYANETALTHYQEARRRLERVGEDALELARLDEKLGGVLYTAGKYDDAVPILERAIAICDQNGDLEGAGRAAALLGRTNLFRGTPDEGIALVTAMIDRLKPSGPSLAGASLAVALSQLYFLLGRYQEMLAAAERGSEIARVVGDQRLLGEAEARRGDALRHLEQPDEAYRVIKGALPLIAAGGDLLMLSAAMGNLAVGAGVLGKADESRTYMEQALAVAERVGNPSRLCFALCVTAQFFIAFGDWHEAGKLLQRAQELERTLGSGQHRMILPYTLGQLALREGRWDEASHLLQEALAAAEQTGNQAHQEGAQISLAELDVLDGRPKQAIARLEALLEKTGFVDLAVLPAVLAWAYLSLDDERQLDRAAELADWAVRQGEEREPGYLAWYQWLQAMVLIRRARYGEAECVLGEGLTRARSMQDPYIEARILVQMGTLHQQRGEPDLARERLEEALAIFSRLGAKKDVEQTAVMLDR